MRCFSRRPTPVRAGWARCVRKSAHSGNSFVLSGCCTAFREGSGSLDSCSHRKLRLLFSLMPRPGVESRRCLRSCSLSSGASTHGQHAVAAVAAINFRLLGQHPHPDIDALSAVGLFMGINLLQGLARRIGFNPDFNQPPTLPLSGLIGVLFAGFAATFIGPYTYHLYHLGGADPNPHVPDPRLWSCWPSTLIPLLNTCCCC